MTMDFASAQIVDKLLGAWNPQRNNNSKLCSF